MRRLSETDSRRIRSDLLESEQQLSSTWASVPGRFVAPAEEISDLIDDPSGVRVLSAFAARGCSEVYCATTFDLGSAHADQAVITPLAEVNEWRWDHAPFDVVVASQDLAAVVLLSVDEFILVGGDRGFVESALGRSIEVGCAELQGVCRGYGHRVASSAGTRPTVL